MTRIMLRRFLIALGFILVAGGALAQDARLEVKLRLTLPPAVYAVAGEPMAVYYDNVVLTERLDEYRFETACDVGQDEPRRWTVIPTNADVGEHPLTLYVRRGDERLAQAQTTLRVVRADAGKDANLRLLIVGDSLTHATLYPNELARLLARLEIRVGA